MIYDQGWTKLKIIKKKIDCFKIHFQIFINLTQDEREELNYLVIDLMNLVEESGKNALFSVASLMNQDYGRCFSHRSQFNMNF